MSHYATKVIYFPENDLKVVVDRIPTGQYTAYREGDVDDYGRVKYEGCGDTMMEAIADLNTQLEELEDAAV